MKLNRKVITGLIIALSLLVAIAIGFQVLGILFIFMAVRVIWYYKLAIVLPCGLGAIVLYALRRKIPGDWRIALAALTIPLIIVGGIFAERLWARHQLAVAKAYPALIEVQLLDYKNAHGRFPNELTEISGLPQPPRNLSYWRSGEDFEFSYPDPDGGFFSTYGYSSKTRAWNGSTGFAFLSSLKIP